MAVKDVASSKLGSHNVTVEDSVKDISLEEMFQRMYKQGFSESETVVSDSILKNSVKFHVIIENLKILFKRELSKGMDIMLFLYHFVIKSWLCQTKSNKQLKD